MKKIILAIGILSAFAIGISIKYLILLYDDFTQLITILGIAGSLILGGFLYIYNWMNKKQEEIEKLNKAINITDTL